MSATRKKPTRSEAERSRRHFLLAASVIGSGCGDSPTAEREWNPPPARGPLTAIVDYQGGRPLPARLLPEVVLSDAEWRARLTPLAYAVLRRGSTELAYTGRYHRHAATGLYRCAGCGTALFTSAAKFDSRTGWPSFREPAAPENVLITSDGARDEVRCRRCRGHLGHVFGDGPEPTRERFCINSAALRFEPL